MHLNELWLILVIPLDLKFDTKISLSEERRAVDERLSQV